MIAPTKNPQLEDEVHDEALASDAEFELPGIERYTISSFGTDFPVAALYRRLTSESSGDDGDIYIPDFQRGYVWTKPQADRFIESLLLGLPILGIFLSTDPQTNKRFVIDGSQRLRTIRFFIDGTLDGKNTLWIRKSTKTS